MLLRFMHFGDPSIIWNLLITYENQTTPGHHISIHVGVVLGAVVWVIGGVEGNVAVVW